jgi:hypothetical protein
MNKSRKIFVESVNKIILKNKQKSFVDQVQEVKQLFVDCVECFPCVHQVTYILDDLEVTKELRGNVILQLVKKFKIDNHHFDYCEEMI